MDEIRGSKDHKMMIHNRTSCNLTGVLDVLTFDVSQILVETEQGMLMIKGQDLHVNRLTLDKGEIDIEGRMDSFTYTDMAMQGNKSESLLGKLFK